MSRDAAIRSVDGPLVSESSVELEGKYPGAEFMATTSTPSTHLRVRVFLADGWLYQLATIGADNWIRSPEVDRFFNSFALNKTVSQVYKQLDGRFSVAIPEPPKIEQATVKSGPMSAYTWERSEGLFAVRCTELHVSKEVIDQPMTVRLNKARDAAIRGINGTLASESPVQISGKYPGLEFTATSPMQKC